MIDVKKALQTARAYTCYYECPYCGHAAFHLINQPQHGDLILAANCRLLDGRQPVPGDDIVCGVCNRTIMILTMANVKSVL